MPATKESFMLRPACNLSSKAFSKMAYKANDKGLPCATPLPMGIYSNRRPFPDILLLFPKNKFLIMRHKLPLTPTPHSHRTSSRPAGNGLHKHHLIPSMHCTGQLLDKFQARSARLSLPNMRRVPQMASHLTHQTLDLPLTG